jgi:hypothetical protein
MVIGIQEVGFKVQGVYKEGLREGIMGIFSTFCKTLNITWTVWKVERIVTISEPRNNNKHWHEIRSFLILGFFVSVVWNILNYSQNIY